MRNKNLNMPPEEPRSLKDFLWKIKAYEDGIYIREQIGGTWGTIALSKLSPERWAHHVSRFLNEGINPVRIRGKDEPCPDCGGKGYTLSNPDKKQLVCHTCEEER